nr:MAG TPA: Helicase of the snf2 rad54 family [Caudoviricetes sp.]
MNEYKEFLRLKQKAKEYKGFAPLPMNPKLFPFQQHIVAKNILKGKHAVFADCGLGKTVMQLETATQIVRHTNKPVLIIAPLVVVAQTKRESEKFGFDLDKVTITNFENLHNINPQEYAG